MSLYDSLTTPSVDFNNFLTTYQKSIEVTDEKREEYVKKYGKVTLPSEDMGVDRMIRENYLLQYAKINPNEYITKRNNILEKLKIETDQVFIDYFTKYTTGENKLPQQQAKELAFKAANEHYELGIVQLESLYPSKFEGDAYEKIILKQKAQNLLRNSGSK